MMICFSIMKDRIKKERKQWEIKIWKKTLDNKKERKKMKTRTKRWVHHLLLRTVSGKRGSSYLYSGRWIAIPRIARPVDGPQLVTWCLPMVQRTSSRRHQHKVHVDTEKGGGRWVSAFSFNMTRQIISFAKDTST